MGVSQGVPGGFGEQSLPRGEFRAFWGGSPRHISHPGTLGVFCVHDVSHPECPSLPEGVTPVGNPTGSLFILPQESLGKGNLLDLPGLYRDFLQKCPWAGAGWGLEILSPSL